MQYASALGGDALVLQSQRLVSGRLICAGAFTRPQAIRLRLALSPAVTGDKQGRSRFQERRRSHSDGFGFPADHWGLWGEQGRFRGACNRL